MFVHLKYRNKQKQIDMTTSNNDMITTNTILDVKTAWEYATSNERLSHDWIYGVDPETMTAVRKYWKTLDGSNSLYNAFVKVLKLKS